MNYSMFFTGNLYKMIMISVNIVSIFILSGREKGRKKLILIYLYNINFKLSCKYQKFREGD